MSTEKNNGRTCAVNDQTFLKIKNIDIAACTHTGLVQKANEDRYLVRTMDDGALLLAVADGLGGDVGSDDAAESARSRLSVLDNLPAGRETQFLDTIAKDLDECIHKKAQCHPRLTYMATTLVCTVLRSDVIHWVNTGDSRFYVFRDKKLLQISQDQTLAKFLVEKGELKAEDADDHYSSEILDQCLGYGGCEPETGRLKVKKDDLIILATDGLYKMIDQELMLNILNSTKSLEQKMTALMDAVFSSGGKDNITLILAHIKQTL